MWSRCQQFTPWCGGTRVGLSIQRLSSTRAVSRVCLRWLGWRVSSNPGTVHRLRDVAPSQPQTTHGEPVKTALLGSHEVRSFGHSAALTKCHRLGDFKQQKCGPHRLEAGKLRSGCWRGQGRLLAGSSRDHGQSPLWGNFNEALTLFMGAPPAGPTS